MNIIKHYILAVYPLYLFNTLDSILFVLSFPSSTSSDSVTVYLADDIGVDVNANTSSGRVYTDFPVTIQGEISKRSLNAKINNGGPELYLHTSGGSIYIKKVDYILQFLPTFHINFSGEVTSSEKI